jgi:hypothetical protein
MKRTMLVVATLGLALGAVGCGGSSTVSKGDVEKSAMEKLPTATGLTPTKVSCPNDLDAKAGATMQCQVTVEGNATYGLNVTVSSVSGSQVNYQLLLDSKGQNAIVEKLLKDNLSSKLGSPVQKVSCTGGGDAKVGDSVKCSMTASDGSEHGVTVKITKREGTQIGFDYAVDDTTGADASPSPSS